jgi:hypothetical protein
MSCSRMHRHEPRNNGAHWQLFVTSRQSYNRPWVMGERQQTRGSAAGVLFALLAKQRLEGARKGAAGEQLIAIGEVEQRHWLPAQRMDDVAVVDDVSVFASGWNWPAGTPATVSTRPCLRSARPTWHTSCSLASGVEALKAARKKSPKPLPGFQYDPERPRCNDEQCSAASLEAASARQRLDNAPCGRVDVRANADLLAPNQRRAWTSARILRRTLSSRSRAGTRKGAAADAVRRLRASACS